MFRAIEYLLYLFIFLIPWQARFVLRAGNLNGGFWEYGTVALYATDVLFVVILLLVGIWIIRHNPLQLPLTLRGRDRSAPPLKISHRLWRGPASIIQNRGGEGGRGVMKVVAWLVFAGYILLSIFWSFDKPVAFYSALKLFEGIVLFLIVRKFQYSEVGLPLGSPTSTIAWAFVASAVVQSFLAIAQFFTQSVFTWPFSGIAPQDPSDLGVSVVQFADERWLRAYGSFPHPNLLGAFLAIALIIITPLIPLILKGRRGRFWLLVTSYLLLVTGLFFTFSRSAWIAVIVAAGYWLIASGAWRERIVRQTIALLIAYCLLLTAMFFPLVRTRVAGGSRLEIQSNQERTTGYREAIQLIKRHPFFGVGIGNYTVAVARELRPNDPAWSYQPAHNVFLLILSELGLVGLLIFITPFIPLTLRGRRGVYSLPLILMLAILASFDHSLWTLHSGILLLWFSVALIFMSRYAIMGTYDRQETFK